MISKISHALAATAIMLVSGCIAIPVHQENPFNDDVLAFIVPGSTDRAAVAAHLGPADITRTRPALDVYHASRSTAILVSQVAIEELASSHLLFVRYDSNNLVSSYERVDMGVLPGLFSTSREGCSKDSLCVELTEFGDIILFDQPTDQTPSLFAKPPAGHCAVYLYYTDGNRFGTNSISLQLFKQQTRSYAMNERGYLYWIQNPGRIAFNVTAEQRSWDKHPIEHDFACEEGQQYFIHIDEKLRLLGGSSLHIVAEPADLGRQAVSERRPMLF